MANEKEIAFQILCEEIAAEKIDMFFANCPVEKKNTYKNALAARLYRMYEDIFEAGHINAIMFDTVREVEHLAKDKAESTKAEEAARAQAENKLIVIPVAKIHMSNATPEQVATMIALLKHGLA